VRSAARQREGVGREGVAVIPLEGDSTKQDRIQSIEALEQSKVMAKRVYLPQRKRVLGRGPTNFEWVPTLKVIKVDRTPVTRDWTAEPSTGTSTTRQAIEVESKDSINFSVGMTITCRVQEADTARFLYYYAGKSLAEIVDSNIRGFCQQKLANKFGKLDLTACKREKTPIFEELSQEASEFFTQKGVSVDFLGEVKGLQYHNPEIQAAIDKKFINEMDAETAAQELLEQQVRNQLDISVAEAERDAAKELFAAKEALQLKVLLDTARIDAEATKAAAAKWDGKLPEGIMPAGSGLLFGLEDRPANELLSGTLSTTHPVGVGSIDSHPAEQPSVP
ncbi:MAG: hypothetical protein JJ992_09265, partial [Planctomycetes bacterium]|nr:hypothetical protein [Planctomycetota bacterium]